MCLSLCGCVVMGGEPVIGDEDRKITQNIFRQTQKVDLCLCLKCEISLFISVQTEQSESTNIPKGLQIKG